MFLRADYIEKLGTGINRIQEAMIDAGLPKADFQMNYFFSASFPRVYAGSEDGSQKSSQEMSQKIIELMKNNAQITTEQIVDKTGLSRRGVEWNIDKLKKEGKISREGSKKTGRWVINTRE